MAIIKESFVADLTEDNYAVVGNNYYKIDQHGETATLEINCIPIISDFQGNLIEFALCLAIAYGDVL